ncbi:MAG: demethoxyubiquinone hydroxylase family protein [Proteobacteria bacterium]|nr:demethoxyubiquinone hydroxylase family protein [Pseudomonadota bacterium]
MPKPYFYNHEVKINEIIRVDHAGEYGAKRIYQGQIDGASDKETKKVLHHMLEQELEHLSYFETQIENRLTAMDPSQLNWIANFMVCKFSCDGEG